MNTRRSGPFIAAALLILSASAGWAQAQFLPWNVYADSQSASICDLVNAANLELVVLAENGPLVIVTGPDLELVNTFVDDANNVFVDDELFGFIDFAEDGEGFRTLWWLTPAGSVVFVDPITGDPSDSELFPGEFIEVPCDACQFWDDVADCGGDFVDSDLDGIGDPFDYCPDTPLDAAVDDAGCACFQVDTDLDGVNDCDDLCPDSPREVFVDADGCGEVVAGPPPVGVVCGALNSLTLALCFGGLCGLRLLTKRP